MKIKTQFINSMVIFGVMLFIIAASVIFTNQQVERLNRQEEIAKNIVSDTSELSYLSNDYLLYRESQQRARWESKFSVLSYDVSNLNPNTPEQQALVNNIRSNQQRLKAVFTDVVSTFENGTQGADQKLFQISWSRMAVQNQGMAFDAARLSEMLHDQADEVKQTNITLIFVLLGIFGAYFITNYLIVYRRALKSISDLQAGIRIIGSGNLDHSIKMNRQDEIGDLSRAFNQMTADLKSVTASKAELEREITERRRAEETLKESEEKYRTLFENQPVGVGIADPHGLTLYMNQAGLRLHGFESEKEMLSALEQYIGAFELRYLDGRIMPVEEWPASRALHGEFIRDYEVRLRNAVKGQERIVSYTAAPVQVRKGNIVNIVYVMQDITERKHAEDLLHKSNRQLDMLSYIASKLLTSDKPQQVVEELCQSVLSTLDCHVFFNYLVDEDKQRLHLNACAGIPEETAREIEWLDFGVAVCGCAARDGNRIVCENIPDARDPMTELVRSFGVKAYACHPLFSQGRVIGTLSFGTRSRSSFADDELILMKTVSEHVAIAIERERAHNELERQVKERTAELEEANKALLAEIAERKRAVKAERQRFNDILDMLPAYLVLLSPDYHVPFANRFFRERFGESRGFRCFEYLFKRCEPCEICETYSVLETKAPHHWEWTGPDGRNYDIFDFPFTDVDGSTLIMEVGIDITERKQAEEKIREQAALLDKARDAIGVRDLEQRLIYWNKGAEYLYGWTADEVAGKNADKLLYKRESSRLIEAKKSVIEKGEWIGELGQITKKGKEIIVESRWTLVSGNDGKPKSILIINTDITEKKKLESHLLRSQRMESIGTLAGGIAHDLNNVLTPIMLSLQMLKDKIKDEQSQKLINILEQNSKRGADLIKQVLSFAQGVEGERNPLQVRHIITEIEKVAKETFPRNIEIRTDVQKDLFTISGDATQLHQVIMNLCLNARDAMSDGGILSISAENFIIYEDYARMHIDAAVGLTLSFRSQILESEFLLRFWIESLSLFSPQRKSVKVQGLVFQHLLQL